MDNKYNAFVNENFKFDKSPENFKKELHESYRRYFSNPLLTFNLNLTDNPHKALASTFEAWCKIHSKWDRTSLFFGFWDEALFNNLEKWQKIERFIKDRNGLKALDFFKTQITTDDYIDIRVIVAISKLHRILLLNEEAKYYSERAYKLRPDLEIVKVEYASTLHLSSKSIDKELAHKLITETIYNRISKSESKNIELYKYFIFSENYIDSSIIAMVFLNSDNVDIAAWNILEEEYYYCPIFRYEHSVKLANNGDSLFALAKLHTLSSEFPWFKEAIISTIEIINKFRIEMNNPNFMENELLELKQNLNLNG